MIKRDQYKKLWSNINLQALFFIFLYHDDRTKGSLSRVNQAVLPEELLEYFDIVDIKVIEKEVHVYFDEEAIKPEGYELVKLISKGFHPETTIQAFPL